MMPVNDAPRDLLAMETDALLREMERHFGDRGEKPFRARQVMRWVYEGDAVSFDDMTDLPAREREALAESYRLAEPPPHTVERSADGTAKHLWQLEDGELPGGEPERTALGLEVQLQRGAADLGGGDPVAATAGQHVPSDHAGEVGDQPAEYEGR